MQLADDFDPVRDRRERVTRLVSRAGWLVVSPLALVASLRLVAHDASLELVVLNALSQWLYLPAGVGLLVAGYSQSRWLALVSGVLVALHVTWVDPRGLVAAPPPPTATPGHRFRVMSANVLMINDDTAGISAEVLRFAPDLLLVQELSPRWEARFEAPDLRAALPHRFAVARTDSFGIGLYSRLPMRAELLELAELPAVRADVEVGTTRLRVFNVHTLPPRTSSYLMTWNEMMAQVVAWVGAERGPMLLGGDLNVTVHHAWFRRLLATGLRGAHEEVGRTLATTWPNGRMPFPPIRLDHFLVSRQVRVLGVTEGEGRGSDHRPVVADLIVER